MSASGYVHLEDCWVKRVTEKAALIAWEDEEEWIPLSQIADGEDLEEGGPMTVSITEWIAKEKGISGSES